MCKALGYGIRIEGVELVGKSGGKRDFGEVDLPDFDDDEGAK
jgi:molybdenum cofactor biosynthesis enzyme